MDGVVGRRAAGRLRVGGPDTGGSGADGYAVKYDADGEELWRQQFGTPEHEFVYGLALDADGNAFVVGQTFGALDGPQLGQGDAFVVKLRP